MKAKTISPCPTVSIVQHPFPVNNFFLSRALIRDNVTTVQALNHFGSTNCLAMTMAVQEVLEISKEKALHIYEKNKLINTYNKTMHGFFLLDREKKSNALSGRPLLKERRG